MVGSRGSGSHRIGRVEREIREVVGIYLISGFREPLPAIVSVSRVVVSKDLRLAKVYVTIMGTPAEEKESLQILQNNAFDVQKELGRKLRMKFCPKLTFYKDEAFESALRVQNLIREIGTQAEEESSSPSSDEES